MVSSSMPCRGGECDDLSNGCGGSEHIAKEDKEDAREESAHLREQPVHGTKLGVRSSDGGQRFPVRLAKLLGDRELRGSARFRDREYHTSDVTARPLL